MIPIETPDKTLTRFSFQIKYLHFNEMSLFINTNHGNKVIPEKTCHCIISFYCFTWEVVSKTWASCFITVSKHLETWPQAFICFLAFGACDKALALILDMLHETLFIAVLKLDWKGVHKLLNCRLSLVDWAALS